MRILACRAMITVEVSRLIHRRKIVDRPIRWKNECKGRKAILTERAQRIGKSIICEEFAKREYSAFYDDVPVK